MGNSEICRIGEQLRMAHCRAYFTFRRGGSGPAHALPCGPVVPAVDSRLPATDFFPAFHHKTPLLTGNSLFLLPLAVTPGLIDNLANLARLRFSEEEKAAIGTDLQRMIAFVEKLQEVDTTGTAPLLHMTDVMDAYREDEVKGSMQKTTALENAPDASQDYFKVPKVIKK